MAAIIDGSFAPLDLFKRIDTHTITRDYRNKQAIYAQGDRADALFYIRSGYVKLTVMSKDGKKAIIAILREGDFFGEGCITKKSLRISSASAIEPCTIARVTRANISRRLHEPAFAKLLVAHLLLRIERIEEEFVDQIFSSSEKRLARILLLLAGFGKKLRPAPVVLKVSQETLAEMVGTTRSRVSYFMNRFRERGYIDYNGTLEVHPSLLTFLTNK
jgi:CRP/FNR family transcriptional regulator, cyclic AMP receptor protein